jgi:hypothetical protein
MVAKLTPLALVALSWAGCSPQPSPPALSTRAPLRSDLPSSPATPTKRAPYRTILDFLLDGLPPPGQKVARGDDRALQALAVVGRDDLIAQAAAPPQVCKPLVKGGVDVDPLAEIVRRARDTQVVIVNEAHDAPRDREFIADIAAALRPLGFGTYAAETFSDTVERTGPTYPRTTDGTYSQEPVFGDLLRRARALGYAFVPYEVATTSLAKRDAPPTAVEIRADVGQREEAEANNLVARIFAVDPHARVLIHVGSAHALETAQRSSDGAEAAWMALRLKQKTGIDPLTISQTSFGPFGDRAVLCGTGAEGEPLDASFDMRVMQPATSFEQGRPTWRMALGQRLIGVPAALKKPLERIIVEARRASEPDDAVPMDCIMMDPGEDLPLLLPPGSYAVRAKTLPGEWSAYVAITVP